MWIDQDYTEDPTELRDLWVSCIEEAKQCSCLILYSEDSEDLKGAVAEVGAALAGGAKVLFVGPVIGSGTIAHHPSVTRMESIEQAIEAALKICNDDRV